MGWINLADGESYYVEGDEEVFDHALRLLGREPEAERPRHIRWAVHEFERTHDVHWSGVIDEGDDYQALGDMFLQNPELEYWRRSAMVNRDTLLNAETFRHLVDLLTPIRRFG